MLKCRYSRVGIALVLAGCGGRAEGDSQHLASAAGAGGSSGGANDSTGGTATRWGTAWDNAAAGRTPAECDRIADGVASELKTGYCTAVIRIGYESLQILGHAFVCHGDSESGPTNETEARALAEAGVTFPAPAAPATQGALLAPWIFYQSPVDFGGVIVVDSTTGLVDFAATTVWAGTGGILAPSDWSTADLGSGCDPVTGALRASEGLDLQTDAPIDVTAAAKLAEESVLSSIWKACGGGGGVNMVLLYRRTVGALDPQTAEYVVFVHGYTAGG